MEMIVKWYRDERAGSPFILEEKEKVGDDQQERIRNDFANVLFDPRFNYSMAVTHTNEFNCELDNTKYHSDNPYNVKERD